MNASRPLPPCSLLDNRRDGVDVPVYNRAGKVIGYRQSLQTFRALNGEVEQARHLIVRPFRQPITPGAEANLRLLLMRAGVFSDGRPDWAWAPLEQAHRRFRPGTARGADRSLLGELVETVLPDEFLGADITGCYLHRDGLRVEAYGTAYEIRDRIRYVAIGIDDQNCHIPQGAGWAWDEALADGHRRGPRESLYPSAATPGLMRALADEGFGRLDVYVSGHLAMLWDECQEYEEEYRDYCGVRPGAW